MGIPTPYAGATRLSVWMEKTHHPNWTPKKQTSAMRWGQMLEPLLALEYGRTNDATVLTGTFIRHENGVQQGHLDGWVMRGLDVVGIWEGKTGSDPGEWEGGVPEHYVPQVQQYLAITGMPWCDVSVLLPGGDFRTYRMETDLAYQLELEERVLDFWNRFVVPGVIPPEGRDMPELVFPRSVVPERRTEAIAGGVLDLLAKEALETKRRADRYKSEYDALVERMKMVIGENGGADGPGWYVHWRSSKAAEQVEWKMVAQALANNLALIRRMLPDWQESPAAPYLNPDDYETAKGLYTGWSPAARPFLLRSKEDK